VQTMTRHTYEDLRKYNTVQPELPNILKGNIGVFVGVSLLL
jgi:hypothetical protein